MTISYLLQTFFIILGALALIVSVIGIFFYFEDSDYWAMFCGIFLSVLILALIYCFTFPLIPPIA